MIRSEMDYQVWMEFSHNETCYDRKQLIQDMYKEVTANGLYVWEKYYPGTWTVDRIEYH